ncbi:MAG: YchJ family metal-binding protein [Microbacterium pygmaeum]
MTFGSAASSGARADDRCPCGSGALFSGCCAPVLAGGAATTPEQLMRSRYTAFVLADADHLERTWHPRTRPERVQIDPDLTWTGLQIDRSTGGTAGEAAGTVEFRASWVTRSGERGILRETSRFERRGGRWLYLDGEVL